MGLDPAALAGLPPGARIVVGMSGGVDSSVTAALLAHAGYEVIGVTLQLYDHGAAVGRKGACCAGRDILDARRVADHIGIAHYVLDFEARFRTAVIDDFADTYLRGETPIPCIRCNQTVKFSDLLERALDLGAHALATGHYARKIIGSNGAELHRGTDPARDQSYFLFATTARQLRHVIFPLGATVKDETRRLAAALGLPVADKPDSQDICFVPDGDYGSLVAKLRPGALTPGEIVDLDGQVIGRHEGIINFTVGQRRGLQIGGRSEPLYVLRLDASQAQVVVGPRAALARQMVRLGTTNWLDPSLLPGTERPVTVKLRSTQSAVPAMLSVDGPDRAMLTFGEPVFGVAAGQAGVVYDGERVLGGGWILRQTGQTLAA
jgi:tRNA-specific 2-thiouridylase